MEQQQEPQATISPATKTNISKLEHVFYLMSRVGNFLGDMPGLHPAPKITDYHQDRQRDSGTCISSHDKGQLENQCTT